MTRKAITIALLLVTTLGVAMPAKAAGRRTYTGAIDGANYRVEVPDRWNGTLVLFSHGYVPPEDGIPGGIWVANRAETAAWLLDHGYALAASDYRGRTGWAVEPALHDQVALLDWFTRTVGKPRRTVLNGMSMGGGIAVQLAERHPHRFDGVLTTCAAHDVHAGLNVQLDMAFVIRTLLSSPGVDLVKARDPEASRDALLAAVEQAVTTPQGRARLALAGSFGNVPTWYSAHLPQPEGLEDRIRAMAAVLHDAYIWGMGPTGRVDLERRAGGNPSWNTGVDYRFQLARSARKDLVRDAYRAAGIDLAADLDALAAAPRISPDPAALRYAYRTFVPRGTARVPILTMHNTGDGGALPDQERWLASQVPVKQLWVDRGQHCAFSAADEIVALRALIDRIDTGKWHTDRLNEQVAALGPAYHRVFDLTTFTDEEMPPAFTRFAPPALQRPSR
ncbi:alpha/beta hydrolase [Lentzea tibetensis]|uniref:Alpha/beta hydrolase n=1 Tax=Lentzea tibetensis TaxID=2591470 RepID=A0A563EY77_9PSEU|nr:alpha/beta fold hydrolase [Lentzea tibetensis]TWP52687.1 alpha/beta hydrolase [Lentzea tibetensis]